VFLGVRGRPSQIHYLASLPKNVIEHGFGELTGLSVLLARMV